LEGRSSADGVRVRVRARARVSSSLGGQILG